MEDLLHVDPLELEIGYRLIGLADPTRGGDLLDRLRTVRQRVARDLGLIVPQVRIRDEIGLGPHEYRLKIRGTVVGQGIAYAGRLLAVPPAGLVTRPDGRDGVDPVTGQPAVWIHADGREVAELAGCRILEASAVVAGHFGEIVLRPRRRADDPRAGRPAARPGPGHVAGAGRRGRAGPAPAGELQRVLQNLLRERVSIRDLETILETLAVHAGKIKDTDALTEHVRRGLARRITEQYRGPRRPAAGGDAVAAARRPARGGRRPGRDPARRGARATTRPRSIVRAVAHGRRPAGRGGPSAGRPHLGRGPARAQGPDPRRPAAAGRPQPARDPARHARSRSSGTVDRGGARGRDDVHHEPCGDDVDRIPDPRLIARVVSEEPESDEPSLAEVVRV